MKRFLPALILFGLAVILSNALDQIIYAGASMAAGFLCLLIAIFAGEQTESLAERLVDHGNGRLDGVFAPGKLGKPSGDANPNGGDPPIA